MICLEKTRKLNLDILKFIGLFCIMLAHVNPPDILFQLRNFDVILMILVSVFLFFININKNSNYWIYLEKRFKRLILPTWIFLTILFVLNFIFRFNNWGIKQIIASYALKDGIGYVWIIRIYLLVALLLPSCNAILKKYDSKVCYVFVIILYIIYEILCYLGVFNNAIMQYLFAYVIPCTYLILISHWIMNSNNKKVLIFSLINLFIYIILAYYFFKTTGVVQNTNYMKYPFRIYYLSYALFVSSILIIIFRNKTITGFIYNTIIGFVSRHSLWIYLWHILFLQIFKFKYWILNYSLIIVFSLMIVYVQDKTIKILETKGVKREILKIFEG